MAKKKKCQRVKPCPPSSSHCCLPSSPPSLHVVMHRAAVSRGARDCCGHDVISHPLSYIMCCRPGLNLPLDVWNSLYSPTPFLSFHSFSLSFHHRHLFLPVTDCACIGGRSFGASQIDFEAGRRREADGFTGWYPVTGWCRRYVCVRCAWRDADVLIVRSPLMAARSVNLIHLLCRNRAPCSPSHTHTHSNATATCLWASLHRCPWW